MILATILLAAVQNAPASDPWTDAQVLHAGGDTFLLLNAIDDALFESPTLRANLQRIGLPATCAIARKAKDAAVATAPAFRAALIRAMRARIPAERLTGTAFPAFHTLTPYKLRIADALEQDASSGLATARSAAVWQFEYGVAAAPATSGPWADIFGDWDLDRKLAIRHACLQYRLRNPAEGKRAFDGFYKRKETH